MALPTIRPHSAPPSHNRIPASNFRSQVDGTTKGVLSILKDTGWPAKATQDVQGLIETIETKLNLQRIPADDTQIQGELSIAIEHFLKELESVRGRLKEKSRKYDNKKKGLLEGTTLWFSGVKLGDCTEVLRSCRADVERSLTSLNDHLGKLAIKNEQRTSHEVQLNSEENARLIAEGSVGDDSGRLTGTPTVPPPTTTPAPGAGLEPPTNSVPSSIPSDQPVSAPANVQPASVTTEKKKKSPLRGQLLNAAKIASKVAEGASGLPVVGPYIGVAAKVASTMVEMAQAMDDNDERAERLGTHVCNLSEVLERVSKNSRQPEQSQTKNDIEALQRGLEAVQLEVKTLESQGPLQRFWNSGDQSGSLKNLQEKVHAALEEIQLLINLNTSILVDELHNESIQNKHRHLLDRLGDGKYGARGSVIEDVTCLPGTRVEILKRIDEWIRGESNSERVLWIRGMAGRGKSTIASTVAQKWKDRACCATYYFRRGQNPTNSPLVCALAKQLGRSLDPEIKNAILSTVERDEDIINHRLDEQFTALFVGSLGPFKEKASPILIIVDALDECDSVDDAVNFVKLIDRHSSSLPDNLRFLLTSRPEAPLLRALEPRKWHTESLDSIADVNPDLELFVRHALSQVQQEHGIEGNWPAPDDITRLVSMSQGLFQWARTIVKYLGDGSPTDRLSELLESPEAWSGVDELYTQILSKALEKVEFNSGKRTLLLYLLGTLVAAPYPVSLEVITYLHAEYDSIRGKMPETAFNFLRREILADLNSLLFVPVSPVEPIRLMHTSIRDLLVDRHRCRYQPYWIDLADNHQRLGSTCIRHMNRHLRENICDLSDLSEPSSEIQDIVERKLSKGLQYCCRAWSIHLTEGRRWTELEADSLDRQEADFESFSKERILCWLEVMSLVGTPSEAFTIAKRVYHWLSRHPDLIPRSTSLKALWNDVQRFIAAFSEPISFSPLHIYTSALAHCPSETEIWKCYSSYAKVRAIRGLQGSTWPSNLWTRSTDSWVFQVSFSSDGSLLAFGCEEGTTCLCDAQTGRQVGKLLTGHFGWVNSVCFSPDDKLLASGADDRTIRLWDPQTGKEVGEALTGHTHNVNSVCFSPDGKVLASGSSDATIRLWDPQTGRQLGGTLKGHTGRGVRSVCFSPDGKLLASGSLDNTIRMWDPQTGKQIGEVLAGHTEGVWSVCFSPDGKLLASGSADQTILLWDPQTGSQRGEPLTGHNDMVGSVSFSPEGKHLASGSADRTIRLWDPQTGKQIGEPLTGHTNWVNAVCFSPDSPLLASGSYDKTIRLWDPQTGKQFAEPLTGHTGVNSVCFSLEGKLLASASEDKTIRLWDPQTGKQFGEPLTGHTDHVGSVCFSPDSKLLASGSTDETIRLWDSQTGKQIGEPLTGHNGSVRSVSFSPDGKLLASGSGDETIRLWDPQTGKQVGEPLTGHTNEVNSVCFSPDGKLLASGSKDKTIRLWDPPTGKQLGEPLTGHTDWVTSICVSPDGKHLASASDDREIRLWDLQTARQLGDLLKGPGGHRIYYGSYNPPIIWDSLTPRRPDVQPDALRYVISAGLKDHWVTTLSSSRLFWLPSQYWDLGRFIMTYSGGKLAVAGEDFLYIFDLSGVVEFYRRPEAES